jgi:hypothetical protein
MKKYTKKLILFCCTVSLFASCTPYMYIPNTLNMPLAGNKGEVKANICYGSGGTGIQGSYAADSHLVVLADVTFQIEKGVSTFSTNTQPNTLNNVIGDIGAGYYKKFNETGRFEALGGIGYGTANASTTALALIFFPRERINLDAHFYRLFVQGNIGTVRENTEIGFGIRVSSIIMGGSYKVTSLDSSSGNQVLYNKTINGAAVMIEPCVSIAVGLENVKLNFSIGYSGKITGMDVDQNFGALYQPLLATGGITVNLFRELPAK